MRIRLLFFGVFLHIFSICPAISQEISPADSTLTDGLGEVLSVAKDMQIKDSLVVSDNEAVIDSTFVLPQDTMAHALTDTISSVKKKKALFEYEIPYSAKDSLRISIKDRKAFLYGESDMTYDNISLKSEYIELDMVKKTAFSKGVPDSTGTDVGKPVFKQGQEEFESNQITYNFNTKKGIIHEVITEQSGGYMHATVAKRYDNGQVDIRKGKFTTCEDEHPHFYLTMTKAKVIPNNKTITGPAYVVLEDVPLPIGIPFGFIPTVKDNRQSGILLPTWGEEATRGFNLTGGGYYFALNPHYDLRTTFDVYSKGTWGMEVASNYRMRYRFNGSFQTRYYKDVSGEPGLNQSKSTSVSLKWSHTVDPRAIPGQTFSISVDYSTKSFDQMHNYWNTTQLMTNTKRSSIAFSKNWANKPFHLTVNANHQQSSGTNQMSIMFPSMTFKIDRFNPLSKVGTKSGKSKWYHDIQMNYSAQLQNTLTGTEKNIFSDSAFNHMVNGFKHSVPINMNIKLLKKINITPSFTYNGVFYLDHLEKHYDEEIKQVVTDTIKGPSYAHGLSPNLSVSYNPSLYIMGQAINPLATVQKVRDVITSSIGFSFVPDISSIMPNYYRDLSYTEYDVEGNPYVRNLNYSIYDRYLYGTPTLPGKSGYLNFSFKNNLEAKVRPKEFRNDTTILEDNQLEKVKLLENLSVSASYNLFADSMKLSNITFSGSNSYFNNKLSLNFSGTFSPYAMDENGRTIAKYLIQDGGFLRLTNFTLTPSFRIDGTMGKKKNTSEPNAQSMSNSSLDPVSESAPTPNRISNNEAVIPYDYFSVPWSMSVNYNFTYSKQGRDASIIQTLRLNGDLSLTPKWKISFNSGYDVKTHSITHTSININRDLHCWVMTFNVSPFGAYKYYGFQINVKSSVLSDLKYNKNKSQYDYASY